MDLPIGLPLCWKHQDERTDDFIKDLLKTTSTEGLNRDPGWRLFFFFQQKHRSAAEFYQQKTSTPAPSFPGKPRQFRLVVGDSRHKQHIEVNYPEQQYFISYISVDHCHKSSMRIVFGDKYLQMYSHIGFSPSWWFFFPSKNQSVVRQKDSPYSGSPFGYHH